LEYTVKHRQYVVSPACAGIDLLIAPHDRVPVCLPRVRGDRPACPKASTICGLSPPRARGSTWLGYENFDEIMVSPACAGIDLVQGPQGEKGESLPRVRGDRPRNKREQV